MAHVAWAPKGAHHTSTPQERATRNTQKPAVLEHLQVGLTLTQGEARGHFSIMRLASRIDELRREGWNVLTEMILAGQNVACVARYSLGLKARHLCLNLIRG